MTEKKLAVTCSGSSTQFDLSNGLKLEYVLSEDFIRKLNVVDYL